MKQRLTACFLLCMMVFSLAFSSQTAQFVREALQLCAFSVIPSLFPFFVLTALFASLSPPNLFPRPIVRIANKLMGCGSDGLTVFFLGILGGYPLGARTIAQMYHSGRISVGNAQYLLLFCNNAGPSFILGMVGLGCFSSLRIGVYLYLIHVFCAALLGILFRKRAAFSASLTTTASPSFAAALVNSIVSAGSSMVQICSFVVFFVTLLQLLSSLTGITHPLLLGTVELTNGILQLGSTPSDFAMAAALLGWGGISVHLQTAAVLQDTPAHFARYLCAKSAHAVLSFCAAYALSPLIF